MNGRQWKTYDACPVRMVYGRSKNWGVFHETPSVSVFLRGMSPDNLYSTLEHEMIHFCIWKLGERMRIPQEESLIYHMQCAGNDWI